MTDQTSQPTNSTPAPESLDQIAASLEVRAASSNTPPAPKPAELNLPDPALDPAAFNKALGETLNGKTAEQNEILDYVRSQKEREATAARNADIESAVNAISETIEGADKRLVRGLLKDEYDTNPSFQKIWDNRASNPAALTRAIAVLSQNFRDTLAVKVDSQVASDQRVFRQSMQNARTSGNRPAADDAWKNLSGSDFDAKWNALKGGN